MLRLALLCHLSAVSAVDKAENVDCLPTRDDEIFVDFSGAKPQRFLLLTPPAERSRVAPATQVRPCCTTTWAGLPVPTARTQVASA